MWGFYNDGVSSLWTKTRPSRSHAPSPQSLNKEKRKKRKRFGILCRRQNVWALFNECQISNTLKFRRMLVSLSPAPPPPPFFFFFLERLAQCVSGCMHVRANVGAHSENDWWNACRAHACVFHVLPALRLHLSRPVRKMHAGIFSSEKNINDGVLERMLTFRWVSRRVVFCVYRWRFCSLPFLLSPHVERIGEMVNGRYFK